MAGARDERPLLARAAVQRCMPVESIGNARRNLFPRDGRAERWGQRTGSTRGCGVRGERACA
eukprot:scaffold23360_cov40-Phaeocystis_antarctica.AAC.1